METKNEVVNAAKTNAIVIANVPVEVQQAFYDLAGTGNRVGNATDAKVVVDWMMVHGYGRVIDLDGDIFGCDPVDGTRAVELATHGFDHETEDDRYGITALLGDSE